MQDPSKTLENGSTGSFHTWKLKKDYLITVDYYSDFWELDCLPDTTSNTIITCTKAHFARYGVPDTMVTDNRPQFRSHEYEKFAQQWEVVHTTSSPYVVKAMGKLNQL